MSTFDLSTQPRVHFIGIGGIGMSAIARILLAQGYTVSGSDLKETAMTEQLRAQGAQLTIGHDARAIDAADLVIYSSAVSTGNPEYQAASEKKIPCLPRGECLAQLMAGYRDAIAVSGTHGKTTTTGLLTQLLLNAGLAPTYIMGGILQEAGTNAQLGESQYFVAEADESDASFLYLRPKYSIIHNIDKDHLGTYPAALNGLTQAFIQFMQHVPPTGQVFLNVDDSTVANLVNQCQSPYTTYGFSEAATYRATDYEQRGLQSYFVLHRPNKPALPLMLNLPGRHNVENALAAIAVATTLTVPDTVITTTLAKFGGVARRFNYRGHFKLSTGEATVYDDYGHHPRAIAATYKTAQQAWPDRRVVLVFQPHRYTRTQELLEEFVSVLSQASVLVLLEVYAAGEKPIPTVSGQALCERIRNCGRVEPIFVGELSNLPTVLRSTLKDSDIVLCLGAGNLSGTIQNWVSAT